MRRVWWRRVALGALICSVVSLPVHAKREPIHRTWDQLLTRHVRDGLVDYRGFRADRETLNQYLARLAEVVDPKILSALSTEEQLAYWLNLYNACVIDGILDYYPLASVRDVPKFFTTPRCRVGEESLTIDEVAGRGHDVGGHRIHFAIVCASMGCPPLRQEAYTGRRLNAQLVAQGRRYWNDPARGIRVDAETSTVWVSKIVHWNRADFGQRSGGIFGVLKPALAVAPLWELLGGYLDQELWTELSRPEIQRWKVRVIPYDWSLNDVRQPTEEE